MQSSGKETSHTKANSSAFGEGTKASKQKISSSKIGPQTRFFRRLFRGEERKLLDEVPISSSNFSELGPLVRSFRAHNRQLKHPQTAAYIPTVGRLSQEIGPNEANWY